MDIFVIRAIVGELSSLLPGCRIDRIIEEADGCFQFLLRGRGQNYQLLVSTNPSTPRLHLTNRPQVPTERPSLFHQFLKSRVAGGRIASVSLQGLDRVVRVAIETGGQFAAQRIVLIIELLGRSAGMIAVDDDGVILACQRTVFVGHGPRAIVPGLRYATPPPFSGIPLDQIKEPVAMDEISGISPAMKRELLARAGSDRPEDVLEAAKGLADILATGAFSPTIYPAAPGRRAVLSAIPLVSITANESISLHSMNEAADRFYRQTGTTPLNLLAERLLQAVMKHLDRVRRAKSAILQERREWEDSTHDMVSGQTILTWKDRIPRGADRVMLPGPAGDPLTILLDPALSAPANAERYFKRHKKARRGVQACSERLERLAGEERYLEDMLVAVETAGLPHDLSLIEEELWRERYIRKAPAAGTRKKPPSFDPRKVVVDGWEIWIGRSAGDNDTLLRHASADDLWFHAHGVPGSHVIIRNPNRRDVPKDILLRAARLAAGHSRARNDGRVEVVYCQRKLVRKPPGARPGLVTISGFEAVTVVAPFFP